MPDTIAERPLPPLAKKVKTLLRKTPQTPQQLAERAGRTSAQGMGRAFTVLIERGIAERTDDGSYKKKEN